MERSSKNTEAGNGNVEREEAVIEIWWYREETCSLRARGGVNSWLIRGCFQEVVSSPEFVQNIVEDGGKKLSTYVAGWMYLGNTRYPNGPRATGEDHWAARVRSGVATGAILPVSAALGT